MGPAYPAATVIIRCCAISTGPVRRPRGSSDPGNAGSNTAADHKAVLDLALAQLDPQALDGEILVLLTAPARRTS
jgi:hypothetical protein